MDFNKEKKIHAYGFGGMIDGKVRLYRQHVGVADLHLCVCSFKSWNVNISKL